MKTPNSSSRPRGFSLIETVIAIGVLAVLLTGFMIVFAPAAAGIRRAISIQEADRLASTVEQELVTYRSGDPGNTGFEKAFQWIKESNSANTALMVYQYRGSLSAKRPDGTPDPVTDAADKVAGRDYAVKTMLRRKNDPEFIKDLPAVEGGVYLVKCTQLVYNNQGELIPGAEGQIKDPKPEGAPSDNADLYPEAVIAFNAEFYALPGRNESYITGAAFTNFFNNPKKPVFTRNLAVRR
jgi:prepilin-type N-terminal cleavage/methylation domain-containing protein